MIRFYFKAKNFFVKLLYRIFGAYWTKPGLFQTPFGKVYLDPQDKLSAWKRRFNTWENEFFWALRPYIATDEVILEFGSCMGDTSLQLLSMTDYKGQLVGIEPFPRYFSYLKKTQAANPKLKHSLSFINCGFSPNLKSITFTEEANPYNSLEKLNNYNYLKVSGSTPPKETSLKKIKVPTYTLKQILKKSSLSPTLIFMDIEGAELGVLQEIMTLNIKPKIVWEQHAVFYGKKVLEKMLKELQHYGYHNILLDKEHYISLPA